MQYATKAHTAPTQAFFLVDLGSSGKEEHQDGGQERETSSNRFTGKGKGDVILTVCAHTCQVGETSVGEILNMMKKAGKKLDQMSQIVMSYTQGASYMQIMQ